MSWPWSLLFDRKNSVIKFVNTSHHAPTHDASRFKQTGFYLYCIVHYSNIATSDKFSTAAAEIAYKFDDDLEITVGTQFYTGRLIMKKGMNG